MDLIESRSIFSPATGFVRRGGFDWTCNPYVGCTFGCGYCYAAFLPQSRRPVDEWGKWLSAKANAVELARKQAPKIAGAALYMSSVTDPYLPLERRLMLTRGILEALLPHQPRLVIQTRGPTVIRDIDLIAAFTRVRVNVSITTDNEEIRMAFEPKAPSLEARWAAVEDLRSSGIAVGLCVTPTLPIVDQEAFAARLAAAQPAVLVCQEFHEAKGRFGADTREGAVRQLAATGWGSADYHDFVARLRRDGEVYEGEAGFFPPS